MVREASSCPTSSPTAGMVKFLLIQSDESAGVCLLKQAISNASPQFYHDSITLMVQTVKDQAGV